MSNTAQTIQFLKEKPEANFIRLSNLDNDSVIGDKKDIYLSDIPNENLPAYIKFHLGGTTQDILVWVEHRTTKGATTVKVGPGYKIPVIVPKQEAVQVSNQPVAVPPAPAPLPMAAQPAQLYHEPNFGFNGHGLGLNGGQLMAAMVDSQRLGDLKQDYADLKEDYKDLKKDFRKLEIKNTELETKVSTAETQKDLAVMLAKSENKSFFESAGFEKLMENAGPIVETLMAAKAGGAPQSVVAGLSAGNTSEVKQSFFQMVGEYCSDAQVNYLGSIVHYLNNPEFVTNLEALIKSTTHAGHDQH